MFEVIDLYEGYLLVGIYDTIYEAREAANEFRQDTDGECNIIINYMVDDDVDDDPDDVPCVYDLW